MSVSNAIPNVQSVMDRIIRIAAYAPMEIFCLPPLPATQHVLCKTMELYRPKNVRAVFQVVELAAVMRSINVRVAFLTCILLMESANQRAQMDIILLNHL